MAIIDNDAMDGSLMIGKKQVAGDPIKLGAFDYVRGPG
jgi:hypothetical protein